MIHRQFLITGRLNLSPLYLLVGVLFAPVHVGADPPDTPSNSESSEQDSGLRQRYETTALTQPGNPEAGKKLFFDEARGKCSVCHRVGSRGGRVGPDLSRIGGKFDRPHLIESMLEPSRQIVEGYRTTTLVTASGQLLNGVVSKRSPQQIELLDADGKPLRIDADQIEQERISDVSLMPAGLATGLSADEFTDLVAYLESLRSDNLKMGAGVAGPLLLPDGFQVRTVVTGLTGAVAMETTNDGRIFLCEQTGALRVVRDDKLLEQPFVTLPVQANWERGLIGVTVDPDFRRNGFVYVCYVAEKPYPHHVISRWTANGDVAEPDSEKVLLRGDDQRRLGGNVPAGHQGGAIHCGPDGCLYIGIGEQTAGMPAQSLGTLQGKLLRINRDGSIPSDNPLLERTRGKYQSIWAYGLRNPFTIAFQPATGRLLINDVGGKFEEINPGVAGGNYGWPVVEHGPSRSDRFVDPIHIYPQSSIGGGVFVPADSPWPETFHGKYLFADFVQGWIHMIDPATAHATRNNAAETFASGLRRPVDLRLAADGSLYVLLRNAWVIDGKFEPGTSSLLKITYQN